MPRRILISVIVCALCFASFAQQSEPNISRTFQTTIPQLKTNRADIDRAFRIAVGDVLGSVVLYKGGLLSEPRPALLAGLRYTTPWVRDAAMNTWNGGSFIMPQVMHNTLLSVLPKRYLEVGVGSDGHNPQYWDAMIWVTGAWHHYLYTGDREFLQLAFAASKASMAYYEKNEFNDEENLFRGGASIADGVSAYPDAYADAGGSAFLTDWPKANPDKLARPGFGIPMMCLSTNCIYYNAYRTLEMMAKELGEPVDSRWAQKAERLRQAINSRLWNEKTANYRMLVGPLGDSDQQEALGSAYAILFGIADAERTKKVFETQFVAPAGIPCAWPNLARYDRKDGVSFGQHCALVWPPIQSYWATAAAMYGRDDLFAHEFFKLAEYANRDMHFAEMFHPMTGEQYGGLQEWKGQGIVEGPVAPRQVWSATGYMRMVFMGLAGMRFEPDGIRFAPCVPSGLKSVKVENIRYRNMNLNVIIRGTGTKVLSCQINDVEVERPFLSADATGLQDVLLIVGK